MTLVQNGIGGWTVQELADRMTVQEFFFWMAKFEADPFGEARADIRQAMHMKLYADSQRRKGKRPYELDQFIPKFEDKVRQEGPSQDGDGLLFAFYQTYMEMGGDPQDLAEFRDLYLEGEVIDGN